VYGDLGYEMPNNVLQEFDPDTFIAPKPAAVLRVAHGGE